MKHSLAVGTGSLVAVLATFYFTLFSDAVNANRTNPWYPVDWTWVLWALIAVLALVSLIAELCARRKAAARPSLPAVASSRRSMPSAALRATGNGIFKRHGRLTADRLIHGPYVYKVRWTDNNGLVGYLASGQRNGFDVYNENDVRLQWMPSLEEAMALLEGSAP